MFLLLGIFIIFKEIHLAIGQLNFEALSMKQLSNTCATKVYYLVCAVKLVQDTYVFTDFMSNPDMTAAFKWPFVSCESIFQA